MTADERQGAADLLALMHRLGDLLGAELDDWTAWVAKPSGPLRQALNLALGTGLLTRAVVAGKRHRFWN